MNVILEHFIGWLVTFILGGVSGYFATSYKHFQAIENGMRQLLRARLVEIYEKYVVNMHDISVEIKDDADRIYTAYHQLGGNGTGTRLYNDIMNLQIKE